MSGGRRGAILVGLVDDHPDGETLTHLGAEVVRFARTQHGTVDAALDEFASWKGRLTRFTALAPGWAQLARSVAVQNLVERLEAQVIVPAVDVDRLDIEVLLSEAIDG